MTIGFALARSQGDFAPKPPDKGLGWQRYKRVDCMFYAGHWICAVCIREGFDLRDWFCPVGKKGDVI